ncbi:hypothetical protein H5410_007966 [Solanum commersonii]|uniref:Uncharacterized protein n=1 Tax=Solanum commersonii TaxID=4109 RepID=A0A9J6AEN9_SOLCO|nr:hypothetical protein H5410_007966 [Solanum commersonii]
MKSPHSFKYPTNTPAFIILILKSQFFSSLGNSKKEKKRIKRVLICENVLKLYWVLPSSSKFCFKYLRNTRRITTVMWLFSEKLHVQGINYDNKTIRLYYHIIDSYYYTSYFSKTFLDPIFILNCPFAANNSAFVEISGCKLSRYTYLKIGETNASEVNDGCRVQFIGLTSWPNIKDAENNVSLSDFHQAILYGFELRYDQWFSRQNIRTILSLLLYLMGKLLYIPSASCMLFGWTQLNIPFREINLSQVSTTQKF